MGMVSYEVSFANKGEEIKRVERKCYKDRLARSIVDIRALALNEKLSDEEKLKEILKISTDCYW